jgi:RimJ/RimL family protein N-acetyltransferase
MIKHTIGPETARLLHRAFAEVDAEAFFALNGNPVVMGMTGESAVPTLEAARAAILAYPDFDAVGYGRWACVLKETQQVIGFCGLKYLPELGAVDVGYRFLPEYWGRGLATEACRASLQFGFDTLQLDRVLGLVLPENAASIRVLQKVGMEADGTLEYDKRLVLCYSIDRGRFSEQAEGLDMAP